MRKIKLFSFNFIYVGLILTSCTTSSTNIDSDKDISMIEVHAYINESDTLVNVPTSALPLSIREKPSLEKLSTANKGLNLIKQSSKGLVLEWQMLNWSVKGRGMSMLMISDMYKSLMISSRLLPTIKDELLQSYNIRWQPAIPISVFYPLDTAQYGVARNCYVPIEVINKNIKPSYGYNKDTPFSIVYGLNDTIRILYLSELELLNITSKIGYSEEKIKAEINKEPNLYEVWFGEN